tara:strand:+ start:252 stop:752 length:501 start_codon:yes stop_codon:yes gene_type:complete
MSGLGEGSSKEERKPGDGRGNGGLITNFDEPVRWCECEPEPGDGKDPKPKELPRFPHTLSRDWATQMFGPLSTQEEEELSPHDPLSGSDNNNDSEDDCGITQVEKPVAPPHDNDRPRRPTHAGNAGAASNAGDEPMQELPSYKRRKTYSDCAPGPKDRKPGPKDRE